MALGAAFGGTLALSYIFGMQTHADLLLLLAIVAGTAFVFEKVALAGMTKRAAPPASDRVHAAGHRQHDPGDVTGAYRRRKEDVRG